MQASLKTQLYATAISAIAAALMAGVPARSEDLDMKKILRCAATDSVGVQACDDARTLILNNCTACHSFVRVVVQQFDQKGWDGLIARHRVRVTQLTDEQVA